MKYGWTLWYLLEESLHVDQQVLDHPQARQRLDRDLPAEFLIQRTWQASRLRPLMSMASEPQTPWTQEWRKVSVPSCVRLHVVERVQQPLVGLDLGHVLAPPGGAVSFRG